MQSGTRMVLMRGGTSKCAMFHENHLPTGEQRDRQLLSIFGSPDPRQIDGIGGAVSSTSKACIIAPSSRSDADIDYTFGQVDILEPMVDYRGNCGNCSAAVGPFAVDEGLVRLEEGTTTVRIFNTNTSKRIVAEVPVKNGGVVYEGDLEIAGVPGTGAAQRLWFYNPGGSVSQTVLPTGHCTDIINLNEGSIEVSLVDAANPVVFVTAEDIGLTGGENPSEINQPLTAAILQEIRGHAAMWMGLVKDPNEASKVSPAVPKVAVVGKSQDYTDLYSRKVRKEDMDLTARMMSLQKCHTAYPVTGAIATAAAANIDGTVVNKITSARGSRLTIGNPSGIIPVDIDLDSNSAEPYVQRAGVYRTARRILDGTVYY